MITNPAQAAQIAQKLSDGQLRSYALGQSPMQFPMYVAAAEIQRRAELRRSMQGMQDMAGNAQDKSVLEELLDGTPINPQGIGSLPAMTDQSQSQQPASLMSAQPPPQGMQPGGGTGAQMPPTQGYANGGLVTFDDGGAVDPYRTLRPMRRDPLPPREPSPAFLSPEWLESLQHKFRGGSDTTYKTIPQEMRQRVLDAQNEGWTTDDTGAPIRVQDAVRGLPPLSEPPMPSSASSPVATKNGSAGIFTPQPVNPVTPQWLMDEINKSQPKDISAYKAEVAALMPPGSAHEGLASEAAALGERIDKRKSTNVGESLLQAGAAMAASRSPYFMSAVGEGAQSGLKYYSEERKDIDKLEQLRVQYTSTVEQARRAEEIGEVKQAIDLREKADALKDKLIAARATYEAHDVTSQRTLQGTAMTAQAHREQVGAYKELAHQDRQSALEQGVFTAAYRSAKDALQNDAQAMMMSEQQKEEIAIRRARNAVQQWKQLQGAEGGIGSLPPQGTRRGALDAAGNLTR